jgi:hypothetical protein
MQWPEYFLSPHLGLVIQDFPTAYALRQVQGRQWAAFFRRFAAGTVLYVFAGLFSIYEDFR